MTRLVLAAVLLCCGAAACGSDGSPPVLISILGSEISLELLWEPAGGNVDLYAVDWRVPGGTFAEAELQGIGNVDPSQFNPDLSDFEFRVRAEPGSRLSNVLPYHRGTLAASVQSVSGPDPSTNAFVIIFTNLSPTATQVKLERRTVQTDSTTGPWAQIDLGNGRTNTYLDRDLPEWIDGASYEYRATAILSGESDPSSSKVTDQAPLLPPSLVSFTPGGGGATLLIRDNSKYAPGIYIERGTSPDNLTTVGVITAPIPGGTGSFVDSPLSPGIWLYKLVDVGTGGPFGATGSPASFWCVMPDPGSLLSGHTIELQLGNSAVRDASGRFGVAEVPK